MYLYNQRLPQTMDQTTRLKLLISQVLLLLWATNGELMRLISIPERSRSALKGISTTFQDHERVLFIAGSLTTNLFIKLRWPFFIK